MKVFLAGNATSYLNWILPLGFELTHDLENASLVFFSGGEDVSPSLYGEESHITIRKNPNRDKYEIDIYNRAKKLNIPMIGVCRGGQFLTVMNGGKLVQHSKHPSGHIIKTYDGLELDVTSDHHNQFLIDEKITGLAENKDYVLIGWTEKLSPYHFGTKEDYKFPVDYKEPDVVFFPKTRCLALQNHPEWQNVNHPTVCYFQNLVKKFLMPHKLQNVVDSDSKSGIFKHETELAA